MPDYRRRFQPGGTYFFTLVTEARAPILCTPLARVVLHKVIVECAATRPFTLDAMVLLPDHAHAMLTLPPGDSKYSTRLAFIKARFTHEWLKAGGVEQRRTGSRVWNRRRGVWQRRFWEHLIRDTDDRNRHLDYIHYNPVKHGHVVCPHAWQYSTFDRHVESDAYGRDWMCACDGRIVTPPVCEGLHEANIEMQTGE